MIWSGGCGICCEMAWAMYGGAGNCFFIMFNLTKRSNIFSVPAVFNEMLRHCLHFSDINLDDHVVESHLLTLSEYLEQITMSALSSSSACSACLIKAITQLYYVQSEGRNWQPVKFIKKPHGRGQGCVPRFSSWLRRLIGDVIIMSASGCPGVCSVFSIHWL